jgi:hypothetical protein
MTAPDRFVSRLAALAGPIVSAGRLAEYNDFLQRSFPTWVAIRPKGPKPAAATDPVLALLEAYEMAGVTLANFRFEPLVRDEKLKLAYFGCEGATDFWVGEGTGEIHSMYYKECFPEPLGQFSADFLECLLLKAEFLCDCTRERAQDLSARAELYRLHLARMRERTSVKWWVEPYERGLREPGA